MSVRLLRLENLRADLPLGPDAFGEAYNGRFLLAMGLLSAEELSVQIRAGEDADEAKTAALQFGARMTHAIASHPFAGCAFFIPLDLAPATLVAGRSSGCDLTVPDTSVSDRHCELRLDPQGWLFVTDLKSTNGTSINLERLAAGMATELDDEDILTLGRYSFQHLQSASMYRALEMLE